MRAVVLLAVAVTFAGAFACSRSELFGFDDVAAVTEDASTLADGGDAGPAASVISPALQKALNCAELVRDVCGGNMYEPGAPWPTYQRCSTHASRTTAVGPK